MSLRYRGSMRLRRSLITILALLNKRPKIMLVVENTFNIHLKVLRVAYFCHDDPGVHQAVHCHPFLNLVVTFNWFQDSSGLMFFTPCQTLCLASFATSRSLAQILHLQRWPQRHQCDEPTLILVQQFGKQTSHIAHRYIVPLVGSI